MTESQAVKVDIASLDDMFRKNSVIFGAVLSTASDTLEKYFVAVDCARAELANQSLQIILPLKTLQRSGKNAVRIRCHHFFPLRMN